MNIFFRTLFLTAVLSGSVYTQSAGEYRTHQSGNWEDVNTWEKYDGSSWVVPSPEYPQYNTSSGIVTVLNTHVVTVSVGGFYTHLTRINSGGELIVAAAKTLSLANDATSEIDLQVDGTLTVNGSLTTNGSNTILVNGTLQNNGSLSINNSGDAVTFGGSSTYRHTINSGVIPVSTWSSGSTCLITGVSTTIPTGISQAFHHFTWNCPSQSANSGPNWASGTTIAGTLTVTNTNGFQWRLTNVSTGQTRTITINGNVNVNGSTALLTSTGSSADTAAKVIVVVGGSVNVTSGTWSLTNSGSAYAEWRVSGNISITGGTLTSGANGEAIRRTLDFAGGASQNFTVSGGTIGSAKTTFKVSNGSSVTVGFPWSIMAGGTLNLTNGKFITTSTNTLTIPANGNITGGNSTAYVDGPLTITVAATGATKTFPIGKGSIYRPITLVLNHDAATSTTYTAEMFNAQASSRTLPSGLDSVSSLRYYTVAKGSGAGLSGSLGATIQLSYGADDQVPDATLLRAVKDDGAGNWTSLGGSGTANTTGTITSNTFFSLASSTDFILGTATPAVPAVVPTVSTTSVSSISTVTASGGGNVTNDGGASVTERGMCWNTTGAPTTADSKTTDGTGNGSYTSSLASLTAGTTYYVRAYAVNTAGTGYGNEVSFTTLSALVVPTVTTNSISNIVNTTATGGGTVTEWGGTNVTARGICWNTAGTPTLGNALDYTTNGSGIGAFTSSIGGLSLGTTYYVRAYATNGTGTAYGSEVSFTTPSPLPDVTKVVAADGSGDYTTVQAAFDAVTSNYTGKWYIYVKSGIYYEKLVLAAGKINVVLVGEDRDNTILTYDDYSGKNAGSSGTSTSYSIAIDADDFEAQNITFRNTATAAQAVALRVNGDRQEYYNCKMLGYQDTYYLWGGGRPHRIYNSNCIIQGSVDFIFGRDIALFENCTLNVIRNNGTITAANTDAGYSFGFVFKNCTITNDATGFDGNPVNTFFLGRPWQANPRVAFLTCSEPAALDALGWSSSSAGSATTSDCSFAEYNCTGAGSSTSGRAAFSTQLSSGAAAGYTIANIFAKNTSSSPYGAAWTPSQETINYGALPVELIAFTASAHGKIITLEWKTATETNNSGFEIQKRVNGVWTSIGTVHGAGTSNVPHSYSFIDAVQIPSRYSYRLKQIDRDGTANYSETVEAVIALSELEYALSQNYPNPFNPSTSFSFAVKSAERTTVKVINAVGQEMTTLFNDVAQPNQLYTVTFDAKNLPSGIYFYSLRSAHRYEVRKMLLLK